MISASAIRPVPLEPNRIPMSRSCPRCGIEWTDHRSAFVRDAPCADCRDALIDEQVDPSLTGRKRQHAINTIAAQWRRPKGRAAA